MIINKPLVVCVLVLIAFWPLGLLLPRQVLFDFVNALGVTLGIGVLLAYVPGMVDAYRTGGKLEKGHYLVLGIIATWVAMISRTAFLWWWRWMGEPAGGLDTIFLAFIAWFIVVGGILHLLSPKVIDGDVPREGWLHLKWAVLLGLCLWGAVLWVRIGGV